MAFVAQVIDKGLDLSGINPITGVNINQVTDNAVVHTDKGVILYSVDTALNTPNVPNPATDAAFKRYHWTRIPHVTAVSQIPKVYAWNDNAANDATLLHWVEIVTDTSSLQAEIDATTIIANQAKVAANAAGNSANIASQTANAAALTASNAEVDAQNAAAAAQAAQVAAQNAEAQVATSFNLVNRCSKFSESYASGTNGPVLAGSPTVRILNTTDSNAGALFTLDPATGKLTCNVAGTYNILASSTTFCADDSSHRLVLVKDDGIVINGLLGTTSFVQAGRASSLSILQGIITLAINDVIKLESYWVHGGISNITGGINSNNGTREVYTTLEIIKLNS